MNPDNIKPYHVFKIPCKGINKFVIIVYKSTLNTCTNKNAHTKEKEVLHSLLLHLDVQMSNVFYFIHDAIL